MGLLERLIDQAKHPRGFVGAVLLQIMNHTHRAMSQWAMTKIDLKPDAVVLEIGCGGGRAIKRLSQMSHVAKVCGIDVSDEAVKSCVKLNHAGVQTGQVEVRQASVLDIPFSDCSFDVAVAFQTHYFWPDLESAVQEVCRVLRPGGQFLVVSEWFKINYHMTSYKTKEDMEHVLKTSGFTQVSCVEDGTRKWVCFIGVK